MTSAAERKRRSNLLRMLYTGSGALEVLGHRQLANEVARVASRLQSEESPETKENP